MPLPNTRLIHNRFEEHHRPVADGQATAECRIERPSSTPTAWNDTTGRNTYPDPVLVYAGPCRVQHLGSGGRRVGSSGPPIVGDRGIPVADYRVTVPTGGLLVQVNDLVTVTASADNADAVGVVLTVTAVSTGSITWQRDLSCQVRQPTTR